MIDKLRAAYPRIVGITKSATDPSNVDQNFAIEVREATLQYPLGPLIKGSLKSLLFAAFGHRESVPRPKFVDAIQNLSISIAHGERVALIGRNGSGKSTLLRSLAGIYPLKSGDIRVSGQIGTLLDISLGFEPEATGRENIYYRGMAMGYSPKQLKEVEHEIVDFAQLAEFIDLPVRTYSAGMYVRLGFAISTAFSPDILLVDEVFGAGDLDFSHRAIARMRAIVERSGIMVLATHDMPLTMNICTRVIWLSRGKVIEDGPPQKVVPLYLQHTGDPQS